MPAYSIAHSLKILEVMQEIFEDIPKVGCALKIFSELPDSHKYENAGDHLDNEDECHFTDYFDPLEKLYYTVMFF